MYIWMTLYLIQDKSFSKDQNEVSDYSIWSENCDLYLSTDSFIKNGMLLNELCQIDCGNIEKNNDYMLYPLLPIVHVVVLRIDMGLATILYTQCWDWLL